VLARGEDDPGAGRRSACVQRRAAIDALTGRAGTEDDAGWHLFGRFCIGK
jgi:hypothetical protein